MSGDHAIGTSGVVFHLMRATVGVATPDEATAGALARLLPSYAQPLTGARCTELWRLDRSDDGWCVVGPLADPDTFGNRATALEALEYLVVLRLLYHADGITHLHASGTMRDGEAILALGDSGAGKTSLAFHWSLAGLPVLADDLVFVESDGTVQPFKRLFNVDRRRFADAALTPDAALVLAEDDEFAWFDPASHGGWAGDGPVDTVARITFDDGASETSIEPMSTMDTLTLLLASVMDGGLSPEVSLDRLARVAERARGARVTFGDARDAATALVEW